MNFHKFIKDKVIQMILLVFAIFTIEIFLLPNNYNNFIRIYIPMILVVTYVISIVIEFCTKRKFYNKIVDFINDLDEKYLIAELIKNPNFCEGELLIETLKQTEKSMLENVNKYKYLQEDYKEYIELWIHEIKIPIAASKMIIENNKNQVTKSIDEELDKVENFVEQALYYARSNNLEKDYYIKKSNLKEIVNECIKKNKSILIEEDTLINLHDLDMIVNTDDKWIMFILNQILQNSIKYRKANIQSKIEIYAEKFKEKIVLHIKDNGIGIKSGEVERVFEKGFTGTNGRLSNKKSTGIGLYLCKKLCDKLGIGIKIESVQNEGTEVIIIFPNSSYVQLD